MDSSYYQVRAVLALFQEPAKGQDIAFHAGVVGLGPVVTQMPQKVKTKPSELQMGESSSQDLVF